MNAWRPFSWLPRIVPQATWIVAAIIAGEAAWIAQTFSSSSLLTSLGAILALALAMRLRTNASDETAKELAVNVSTYGKRFARGVFFFLIAIFLASVVAIERSSNYEVESINYLILVADLISHLAWLITALMLVVWPRTGHPNMLPLGAVIGLVTIAAGGVSQSLNSQTAAALAFCIVFVTGSQTVGVATAWFATSSNPDLFLGISSNPSGGSLQGIASGSSRPTTNQNESTSGLKWLMSLAVLSVILTMTSTLARVTQGALPNVQSFLQHELRDTLNSVTINSPIGTGMYVNGTNFGSIRNNLVSDPQGIAINAYAESAPGYLRGNVFDVFNDRRWLTIEMVERYQRTRFTSDTYERSIQPSEFPASLTKFPSTRRLRHFDLQWKPILGEGTTSLSATKIQTVEVQNFSNRGSVVFTPASSVWFEASSRLVTLTHHSIVSGSGVDFTQPYVAGVSEQPEPSKLSTEMREVLLAVPESIAVVADSIIGSELKNRATARQKANAISSYFQREYTYSTKGVVAPRSVDPIVHFLQVRHPAHCEFFATASAMILRRAGVPTRYVTGYVADEASDEEKYWIARNSDAHAWVEAYDEMTQTWFPVESTPGRSYQTVSFVTQDGAILADSSVQDESTQQDGRSLLGQLVSWWAMLQSNDPMMTALRYSQLPLLIFIGTLVWLRRRWINQTAVDPIDIQSHKLLARVDRRLRRHGLVRAPRETLHQFADRIESKAFEKAEKHTPSQFACWYRDYGNARYQGQLPAPLASSV